MLTKELQDLAWSVLPKAFKEEVKKEWELTDNAERLPHDAFLRGKYQQMRDLFGIHNLTSDAEGEIELLHVTRQKVMGLYANAKKIHELYTSATCINTKESQQIDICKGIMSVLDTLFGSKRLPDEANVETSDSNVESLNSNVDSSESKPAEPRTQTCTNIFADDYLSHRSSIDFDTILKDGFRNERRLNIATQICTALIGNQDLADRIMSADEDLRSFAHDAYIIADALLAECENKNNNKQN